jgi:predicted regulator of Ras-like GTPase activity (Roadblock/LC7/MglB family)
MTDDITRWSEELARDPSSRVFLQLGDALRRNGQLDVALKIALRGVERHPHDPEGHDLLARIAADTGDLQRAHEEWMAALRVAPGHVGAMKGLGYVSFQQRRFEDAERYLAEAAANGGGSDVTSALETVRRNSGGVTLEANPDAAEHDPRRLFADVLLDDGQTALLLDAGGYVLGGTYLDADGVDVAEAVGAQLSGISEEVQRATRHLDMGAWRSIIFETQAAVVAMAPAPDDALLIVAASRATPLGLLRRLLATCSERVTGWLAGRGVNAPDAGASP